MSADHPFTGSYRDRHGKIRWRFRRNGKTRALPEAPGHPEFEEAYRAAIEGREPRRAQLVSMPGKALPETFGAAWRKVTASADWKAHDEATKSKNRRLAETFLTSRVVDDHPMEWKDIPIKEMRRRHLKDLIARHSRPAQDAGQDAGRRWRIHPPADEGARP